MDIYELLELQDALVREHRIRFKKSTKEYNSLKDSGLELLDCSANTNQIISGQK